MGHYCFIYLKLHIMHVCVFVYIYECGFNEDMSFELKILWQCGKVKVNPWSWDHFCIISMENTSLVYMKI